MSWQPPGFQPPGWQPPGWQPENPDAPTLIDAAIKESGEELWLTFSEAVQIGSGGSGGFSFTVTSLTYDRTEGGVLVYRLDEKMSAGTSGLLSYTQPGDGVESLGGVDVTSFGDYTIRRLGGGAGTQSMADRLLEQAEQDDQEIFKVIVAFLEAA